jgi:hypothetical protein
MTDLKWGASNHPLEAWRHDRSRYHDQLVHAVNPGDFTAACGVMVTVFGPPWPDPSVSTPSSRCSVCTRAVQAAWQGSGSQT